MGKLRTGAQKLKQQEQWHEVQIELTEQDGEEKALLSKDFTGGYIAIRMVHAAAGVWRGGDGPNDIRQQNASSNESVMLCMLISHTSPINGTLCRRQVRSLPVSDLDLNPLSLVSAVRRGRCGPQEEAGQATEGLEAASPPSLRAEGDRMLALQ